MDFTNIFALIISIASLSAYILLGAKYPNKNLIFNSSKTSYMTMVAQLLVFGAGVIFIAIFFAHSVKAGNLMTPTTFIQFVFSLMFLINTKKIIFSKDINFSWFLFINIGLHIYIGAFVFDKLVMTLELVFWYTIYIISFVLIITMRYSKTISSMICNALYYSSNINVKHRNSTYTYISLIIVGQSIFLIAYFYMFVSELTGDLLDAPNFMVYGFATFLFLVPVINLNNATTQNIYIQGKFFAVRDCNNRIYNVLHVADTGVIYIREILGDKYGDEIVTSIGDMKIQAIIKNPNFVEKYK